MSEGTEAGIERIVLFSDAVIAIAITLLVLDIKPPELPKDASSAALAAALRDIAPKISAYVVSFLVVGQFWYMHFLRFRFIRRSDGVLIWLNLFFLMAIGFVPFASAVLSEHADATAFALYDGTMALASLLSAAIWGYAIRGDRLVAPDLDAHTRHRSLAGPLTVAAVFFVSGIAAQSDTRVGHWALLLLIPAAIARPHKRTRKD
jgi:TMEM175 potassium channel family protein